MRKRATLVLMEQAVMVLVFALAAALCIRVFVLSDSISRADAARNAAVPRAESAAEIYKTCAGSGSAAVKRYGGTADGGVWTIYWDENWKQVNPGSGAVYRLRIQPENGSGRLGRAGVTMSALRKGGKILISFPLAWQRESGNEE